VITTRTIPSKQCTVWFADVIGSTSLYERLGDRAAFSQVDRCLKLMQRAVLGAEGRVVKLTGDGVMAIFDTPDDALAAAIELNLELEQLPVSRGHGLGVRIGFIAGEVVESNGDIFGDTVNIAARLCQIASATSAMTSQETAAMIDLTHADRMRPLPPRRIKGVQRPVAVCELVCGQMNDLTIFASSGAGGFDFDAPDAHRLVPRMGGRSWRVGGEVLRLSVGRDPACEVLTREPLASRRHCDIEQRGDAFVLIDRSSNGTFVSGAERAEFMLHRDETVLPDHGWLSFGQPRVDAGEVMELEIVGNG
jgi:adenylate cyclase